MQDRPRLGINAAKVQELHDGIREGTIDLGPTVDHLPIDPLLRPNDRLSRMIGEFREKWIAPSNQPATNGWNPH